MVGAGGCGAFAGDPCRTQPASGARTASRPHRRPMRSPLCRQNSVALSGPSCARQSGVFARSREAWASPPGSASRLVSEALDTLSTRLGFPGETPLRGVREMIENDEKRSRRVTHKPAFQRVSLRENPAQLSHAAARDVERHLADCDSCATLVAESEPHRESLLHAIRLESGSDDPRATTAVDGAQRELVTWARRVLEGMARDATVELGSALSEIFAPSSRGSRPRSILRRTDGARGIRGGACRPLARSAK